MNARPRFDLQVAQNRYLSAEESDMDAILTISARDLAAAAGGIAPEAAEIVLVDCSVSMGHPGSKMVAARRATIAAIESVRDGTHFAVVEGTDRARMVYPREERTRIATPRSKAEAEVAVEGLHPNGGTAMGTWLALARRLLAPHPEAIRHVVLLTDGRNESEPQESLGTELAACAGRFSCDARGIGDGWEPEELLRIVSALGGSADAVRSEAELEPDFRELMRAAMGKVVPASRIRIKTMKGVRLRFVKQIFPVLDDLSERIREVDARTFEFDAGAWGDETREYQLCLVVEYGDRPMGEDRRLARVDLLVNGTVAVDGSPAPILVNWTDDARLSSVIGPKLSRYAEHAELKEAIDAGYAAYQAGERERAAAEWARASSLATRLGNERVLGRLRHVVEVDDDGRGRLRGDAGEAESKWLRIASRDTRSSAPSQGPSGISHAAARACPTCLRPAPPGTFCTWCGATLGES
jgi:Ca-activated chloride channel family protein